MTYMVARNLTRVQPGPVYARVAEVCRSLHKITIGRALNARNGGSKLEIYSPRVHMDWVYTMVKKITAMVKCVQIQYRLMYMLQYVFR